MNSIPLPIMLFLAVLMLCISSNAHNHHHSPSSSSSSDPTAAVIGSNSTRCNMAKWKMKWMAQKNGVLVNHSSMYTLHYFMFSPSSCFHLFKAVIYFPESSWTLVEWNSCWVKLTSLDLDLRLSADSGARLPEQSDGDLDQHTISLSQLATWKIIFLLSVFLWHRISYLSFSEIF